MGVFREYHNTGKDRSQEDRRRHRELVEDAIKKNIGDIIAEENIIGQNKEKKIKIPIKGIKEYRFIHGINGQGVSTGTGEEQRGDRITKKQRQLGQGNGDQAGNNEGEDIYETEITIEDLVNYLFENLDLPFMERKKLSQLETERTFKKSGYKRKGVPPRFAKKRTVVEKIKRKKAYIRSHEDLDDDKRFPFHNEDIRYYRVKEEQRRESNAVVICIMDTSGSMDQTKKYLARSFYFLLYQFILMKYQNIEIVFIAHSTTAKEVTEDEFFHKGESGGTYISSGYGKALKVIEERYDPSYWNVYCFHCSDGDNWREDNERAVENAKKLCQICNLFGYGEIKSTNFSVMKSLYTKSLKEYNNFSLVIISKKEDIWPSFKKMLENDKEG
ncbi:MAG: sporulation protein YhbH [Halanaerobiales bacterium]|nr:sporulation protein YhbH [Halanaerobiales bacterium]